MKPPLALYIILVTAIAILFGVTTGQRNKIADLEMQVDAIDAHLAAIDRRISIDGR